MNVHVHTACICILNLYLCYANTSANTFTSVSGWGSLAAIGLAIACALGFVVFSIRSLLVRCNDALDMCAGCAQYATLLPRSEVETEKNDSVWPKTTFFLIKWDLSDKIIGYKYHSLGWAHLCWKYPFFFALYEDLWSVGRLLGGDREESVRLEIR